MGLHGEMNGSTMENNPMVDTDCDRDTWDRGWDSGSPTMEWTNDRHGVLLFTHFPTCNILRVHCAHQYLFIKANDTPWRNKDFPVNLATLNLSPIPKQMRFLLVEPNILEKTTQHLLEPNPTFQPQTKSQPRNRRPVNMDLVMRLKVMTYSWTIGSRLWNKEKNLQIQGEKFIHRFWI